MDKESIIKEITEFVLTSPANDLRKEGSREMAWGKPIVGFASGADPIYLELKKDIGDFWWTPIEAYRHAFPDDKDVKPEQLTVVSWVLPHTPEIIATQRQEKMHPSQDWIRARRFGEMFLDVLRKHMADWLTRSGIPSVAPVFAPGWKWTNYHDRYKFASNWSERHTAYIAGLGTFGLCDGLITPLGKAVRIGSVVAKIDLEPTPRPYQDKNEYCLYYSRGICQRCVQRCPSGAISERGHDKVHCFAYCQLTLPITEITWGIQNNACGLCQAGVPCEHGIPGKTAGT